MLSYRYWFLGKLRTAFYWTKIWRKVTTKFGLVCWGTDFGKFANVKDSLVNKLFSYHPSGVWQIFITGMYYYLGVQMPSSDIIFGWELSNIWSWNLAAFFLVEFAQWTAHSVTSPAISFGGGGGRWSILWHFIFSLLRKHFPQRSQKWKLLAWHLSWIIKLYGLEKDRSHQRQS